MATLAMSRIVEQLHFTVKLGIGNFIPVYLRYDKNITVYWYIVCPCVGPL